MRTPLRTVVVEEAIRSMAFVGILLFLVWPAIDLLLGEPSWSPWLFVLPVLWFPLGVWLRVRTSNDRRRTSPHAGWTVAVTVYLLSLGVLVVATFTNQASLMQSVLAALGGGAALLVYGWTVGRPSTFT